MSKKFANVDEYISTFPKEVQQYLEQIRTIIRTAAPEAEETISYNMPAYKLNGPLVYFGANNKHTGFYPTPSPIAYFEEELTDYVTSKGAIQFPLDKPLPKKLIAQIVAYRVKENKEKK